MNEWMNEKKKTKSARSHTQKLYVYIFWCNQGQAHVITNTTPAIIKILTTHINHPKLLKFTVYANRLCLSFNKFVYRCEITEQTHRRNISGMISTKYNKKKKKTKKATKRKHPKITLLEYFCIWPSRQPNDFRSEITNIIENIDNVFKEYDEKRMLFIIIT